MKSAIEDLLNGKFGNHDFIRRSEEERRNLDKINESEKKLREYINQIPEAAEVYKQFQDASDAGSDDETCHFYKLGFRDGFRLALDVLDGDDI